MTELKRLLNKVDNAPLGELDLIEVIEALDGVESKYYSIGLALRLRPSDLDTIRANHGRDVRQAMEQVLKLWLNLNYDDEKHGMPTWRKVVEAADKRSAGNNHALAKAIAADHPLDTGNGAAKPKREANMGPVNTSTLEEASVPVSESATEPPQHSPANNYQLTSDLERDHPSAQPRHLLAESSALPLAPNSPLQSAQAYNSGQAIVGEAGPIPRPSLPGTHTQPSPPTHTSMSSSQVISNPPSQSTDANSGGEFVGTRQNFPIGVQSPPSTTSQPSQRAHTGMDPTQSVSGVPPVSHHRETARNHPPSNTSYPSSQGNLAAMDPIQSVTHRDPPPQGYQRTSEQVLVGNRQHQQSPLQALPVTSTQPSTRTHRSMDPVQSVSHNAPPLQSTKPNSEHVLVGASRQHQPIPDEALPAANTQPSTRNDPLPPSTKHQSGQELVGIHQQPIRNESAHGHKLESAHGHVLSKESESDVRMFVGPGIHQRRGPCDDELDSPLCNEAPLNLTVQGGMPKSPPSLQGGHHVPRPSQPELGDPNEPHPSLLEQGPREPHPAQNIILPRLQESFSQPVPCEEVSLGLSKPSVPHSQLTPTSSRVGAHHSTIESSPPTAQEGTAQSEIPPSPPQSMAEETREHLQDSQSDASKKVHYEANPILFKEIDRERVGVDGGKINFDRYHPFKLKDEEKFRPIKLNVKIIKPKKSEKRVIEEVGEYDMSKSPHGLAVIINNKTFKRHDCRDGTEIDERALITTFRYLGYTVEVHKDCSSIDMCDIFEELKTRDHSGSDSFVCCILSHGSRGKVFGSDSEYVTIESLTNRLAADSCPKLAGKPKLFFIQACRGNLRTGTVIVTDGQQGQDTTDYVSPQMPESDTVSSSIGSQVAVDADIKLPFVTDFYIGFATSFGHVSYRDRDEGTWYVSELCKTLCTHGTYLSLDSMMKIVNNNVSTGHEHLSNKQAPEVSTKLRTDVYF